MEKYPKTGEYREIKNEVNSYEYPTRSIVEKIIVPRFFGIDKGELSKEEVDNFEIFMKYAYKRVLRGAYSMYSLKNNFLSKLHYSTEFNPVQPMGMHDIAHVIVSFDEKAENNHSLVSDFFKGEEPNNEKVIQEEGRALVWASVVKGGEGPPASLMFIDEPSYESFKKKYLSYIYKEVFRLNEDEINKKYQNDPETKGRLLLEQYKLKLKIETENTDQKLDAWLRRIYENKEDKKILYKIFFDIVEPLINRLKKSKEYSIKD